MSTPKNASKSQISWAFFLKIKKPKDPQKSPNRDFGPKKSPHGHPAWALPAHSLLHLNLELFRKRLVLV